jgi:hypothetical protein
VKNCSIVEKQDKKKERWRLETGKIDGYRCLLSGSKSRRLFVSSICELCNKFSKKKELLINGLDSIFPRCLVHVKMRSQMYFKKW